MIELGLNRSPPVVAPLFFTSPLSTCDQRLIQVVWLHVSLSLYRPLQSTLVSLALETSGICTNDMERSRLTCSLVSSLSKSY
jgi:hypothetical protein